jgi:hypothetical protein
VTVGRFSSKTVEREKRTNDIRKINISPANIDNIELGSRSFVALIGEEEENAMAETTA